MEQAQENANSDTDRGSAGPTENIPPVRCKHKSNHGNCTCIESKFYFTLWYGLFPFDEECYVCTDDNTLIRALGNVVVRDP